MRNIVLAAVSVFLMASGAQASTEDTINVRTSPLSWLLGVANIRGDFRIGDQLTLGPQIEGMNTELNDVEVRGGRIGFNVVYHLEEAFADGWYFDGGVYGSRIKLEDKSTGQTAETSNAGISGMFGYHWFWETFNLNLGAGLQTNSAGEVEIKDASGNVVERVNLSGASFALDFSIGWTF